MKSRKKTTYERVVNQLKRKPYGLTVTELFAATKGLTKIKIRVELNNMRKNGTAVKTKEIRKKLIVWKYKKYENNKENTPHVLFLSTLNTFQRVQIKASKNWGTITKINPSGPCVEITWDNGKITTGGFSKRRYSIAQS